ncbi:MAG: Fe(2+) transporter permease subunit FeoB [Methylococcales bacterium]|jgi:ferrous iron transport protein B|nr:Fe(2+) transporter permease subunit FeoB [Methylococcales bacterium]MBT3698264.1 Fe(2+) transporter permease subunit FeoB [Methylococcales bacterium]MBT3816555.1 Fe(2+) transporter permease subunit FeoB [Methylococcales bacterium]MBT4031632.1 Fe(2+) transporter permease subunit FeoB [Methylococcales bacterium]MBT4348164.1 Fe(2+) transporter permease subunit FeoB [Methylococcales bacterium]
MQASFSVGVVGNPNCGKTTLFNVLTGSRQHVGNWPGVTVERKTGEYLHNNTKIELVDLPGTYSLEVTDDSVSLDEKIARDYAVSGQSDLIINIIDASNIERNLYLTTQLLEMKVPMLVVLNMMDTAKNSGIDINIAALAESLGCPVVPIIASTKHGIGVLKEAVNTALFAPHIPDITIDYHLNLEQAISELSVTVSGIAVEKCNHNTRWLALRLLEGDTLAKQLVDDEIKSVASQLVHRVEELADEEVDILTADARYSFANKLNYQCINKVTEVSRQFSDSIDQMVLNRFMGIPIFLLVMYLMFMFTINIGSAFIDFFDQFIGVFLIDGLSVLLQEWNWPDWLIVLSTHGLGGGIQVVATFIPIVGFLFLFLSVLEDSGYMARAAFVMDRFMRLIGLPGKSFVPMIVGFGCNVPAIMATRTLESPRDRILTNLMNPFMSCGARLPVYALFAAAFFPVGGQNLVFGLYLIGIFVAVLTGLIMKWALFRGKSMPFIMELPPYHMPTLRGILIRAWERLKTFIFNAGKVIVPMVIVLNFMSAMGTDGTFSRGNSDQSILSEVGRELTPIFEPMGISSDNWPATVGIFTGLLAKEAVVGTLDALYSERSAQLEGRTIEPEVFDLWVGITEAFQTIPENLLEVVDNAFDPLGLNIGETQDLVTAAEEQEVNSGTYRAMQSSFNGKAGAFAYLLFILLYAPCVAATAAIYKETSLVWAVFVLFWTTGIAYMSAVISYQWLTFDSHPVYSMAWIISMLSCFLGVILILKIWGNWQYRKPSEVSPVTGDKT